MRTHRRNTEADAPPASPGRRDHWTVVVQIAKFGLSVLIVLVLVEMIGMESLWHELSQLSVTTGLLAGLLVFSSIALSAIRWHAILSGTDSRMTRSRALRLSMVSLFFSQALPSMAGGDIIRVFAAIRLGEPPRLAFTGVVIDRLFGIYAIALIMLLTLPAVWDRLDDVLRSMVSAIVVLGFGGLVVLILGHRLVPTAWQRFRVVSLLLSLNSHLWLLLARHRCLLVVVTLSMVSTTAGLTGLAVIGWQLGITQSLAVLLCAGAFGTLASIVPLSIAGWGLREGAMVLLLAGLGTPPEKALALSVLYGMVLLLVSLPGSLLWLRGREIAGG